MENRGDPHWLVGICLILIGFSSVTLYASEILVAAAASLEKPLTEVRNRYQKADPSIRVILNFGASGALQMQIENGAPVDVFLSAAEKQMDALEKRGLLLKGTRTPVLTNSLVLIAPKDSKLPTSFRGLVEPGIRHIAIGEPGSVPVGHYAIQTLEFLGLSESVADRLVLAKDARQVLSYVESGNADAGWVYHTDAQSSQNIRIVAEAPEQSHDPAIVSGSVVTGSGNADAARAFLKFLGSPEANSVFLDAGFGIPEAP